MALYRAFRSAAFCFDAESVHEQTIRFASHYPYFTSSLFQIPQPDRRFQIQVGDLTWSFPVGLPAGMDKNASAVNFFARLPLGALEVGSVTPLPQPGNSRPRLFRLAKEYSLRNHLGLNNDGAETVLDNIRRTDRRGKILGVNIGKNSATPEKDAEKDYRFLYKTFEPFCDYLVINVSSPNTPGLRDFQKKDKLKNILTSLSDIRTLRPLFVKISPELSLREIGDIVELVKNFRLQGIIATNTLSIPERGAGGYSGRLLRENAAQTRKHILEQLRETPHISVIGSGGIENISDLIGFWKGGGKVVQIYTAMIFHGPGILSTLHQEIIRLMNRSGTRSLQELIDNIDQC